VILEEHPYDPFINIALDESILLVVEKRIVNKPILRIWRNSESVVIGRNTNVFNEVRIDKLREYGVPLIRRISGGGAVYHDLGNYNYTLVIPVNSRLSIDYIYEHFLKGILLTLEALGVKGYIENYTDIVVNGFKVSGNSAIIRKNAILIHGTLLVDADLDILCELLKPNTNLIEKKKCTPTKYKVANLSYLIDKELSPEIIIPNIINSFSKVLNAKPIITMCNSTTLRIAELLSKYKYKDPKWNWNKFEDPNIWKEINSIINKMKNRKKGVCNLFNQ